MFIQPWRDLRRFRSLFLAFSINKKCCTDFELNNLRFLLSLLTELNQIYKQPGLQIANDQITHRAYPSDIQPYNHSFTPLVFIISIVTIC